jgi:hypothetical protein
MRLFEGQKYYLMNKSYTAQFQELISKAEHFLIAVKKLLAFTGVSAKRSFFDCLTTVSVMLEQPDNSSTLSGSIIRVGWILIPFCTLVIT